MEMKSVRKQKWRGGEEGKRGERRKRIEAVEGIELIQTHYPSACGGSGGAS